VGSAVNVGSRPFNALDQNSGSASGGNFSVLRQSNRSRRQSRGADARLDNWPKLPASSSIHPHHGMTLRRYCRFWSKARPKAKDWSNQFLANIRDKTHRHCAALF